MERTFRVLDDEGGEVVISGRRHPDWEGIPAPCPTCGATRLRHVQARGGRYEMGATGATRRTDYWDARRGLFTQCLACETVLHKHPATDLLFDVGGDPAAVNGP